MQPETEKRRKRETNGIDFQKTTSIKNPYSTWEKTQVTKEWK
jgi:hypothetical protein